MKPPSISAGTSSTAAAEIAHSEILEASEGSHGDNELGAMSSGPTGQDLTSNSPEVSELHLRADSVAVHVQQQTWLHPHQATVEDCSAKDDDQPSAEESLCKESDNEEEPFAMYDEDEEDEAGLSVEDCINEDVERELAEFGESFVAKVISNCSLNVDPTEEEMTDDDMAFLRQFAFKVDTHITNATFNKLKYVFPDAGVTSLKITQAWAAFLAAFKPVAYNCCINSCCCFVGPHKDHQKCPYHNKPCYNKSGKPRKQFTYPTPPSFLVSLLCQETSSMPSRCSTVASINPTQKKCWIYLIA